MENKEWNKVVLQALNFIGENRCHAIFDPLLASVGLTATMPSLAEQLGSLTDSTFHASFFELYQTAHDLTHPQIELHRSSVQISMLPPAVVTAPGEASAPTRVIITRSCDDKVAEIKWMAGGTLGFKPSGGPGFVDIQRRGWIIRVNMEKVAIVGRNAGTLRRMVSKVGDEVGFAPLAEAEAVGPEWLRSLVLQQPPVIRKERPASSVVQDDGRLVASQPSRKGDRPVSSQSTVANKNMGKRYTLYGDSAGFIRKIAVSGTIAPSELVPTIAELCEMAYR